jgi:hypothetical protein
MSGCLSDYEVWLAHEGEAQNGVLAHLRDCSACASRRRRLAEDIGAIAGTLRGGPPLPVGDTVPFWRQWRLAAAVAAAIVLLAGVETAMWQHSKVIVQPPSQGAAETVALLDDVAAMLAAPDTVNFAALPGDDTGATDDMALFTTDDTGLSGVEAL